MSKHFVYVFILLLWSLSSCVTILQSLLTPATIVTDNRLAGEWHDTESRTIQVRQLSDTKFMDEIKDSDNKISPVMLAYYAKLYVITYKENNLPYLWLVGLVQIQGQYYVNLIPQECLNTQGGEEYTKKGNDHWATSSIAKIEWKDNNTVALHF